MTLFPMSIVHDYLNKSVIIQLQACMISFTHFFSLHYDMMVPRIFPRIRARVLPINTNTITIIILALFSTQERGGVVLKSCPPPLANHSRWLIRLLSVFVIITYLANRDKLGAAGSELETLVLIFCIFYFASPSFT